MRALRSLSSRELFKILRAHGAEVIKSRGKGGHYLVRRKRNDGTVGAAPCPGNAKCVAPGTVGSIRRRLGLAPGDCSDEEFYSA